MNIINTKEVSNILGLAKHQVLYLIKKGQIPTLNKPKKGKRIVFKFDEAEIRLLAPNFQKGAKLVVPTIQDRVIETLIKASRKGKKPENNILHRIESKLDRLLEVFE